LRYVATRAADQAAAALVSQLIAALGLEVIAERALGYPHPRCE
jgi:hypothetical protein